MNNEINYNPLNTSLDKAKDTWADRIMRNIIGFERWTMENYKKYHQKKHD